MHATLKTLSIALLVIVLVSDCARLPSTPAAPATWPTAGWHTTSPEEQGMDSETLAQMVEHIREVNLDLHSLLVVRNGNLVTEVYVNPYTADQAHWVYSVTKSVISTLIGIAIQQGYIQDVQQPLLSFFPDRKINNLDERKQAITLEHLLTQTSGLKCNERPAPGDLTMEGSDDWVQFMLNRPMVAHPGEQFNYCTAAVHLLSAVIQQAAGMSARQFANENLFSPLGIAEVSENGWPSDPQGVSIGGYSLALTPSDMARLGYLFLNGGTWDGKTIFSPEWAAAATTSHANQGDKKEYGYLWWIDPQGSWYAALGRSGQHIFNYPAQNLVVTFTAGLPFTNDADLIPLQGLINQYILPAIQSDQPIQANADGLAQLQQEIHALGEPQRVEPAELPQIAAEIAGKTFSLERNAMGWETISFSFPPGADTATALINGQITATIGLDNVYRLNRDSLDPFPQGLRGYWENQDTFIGETIVLGQTTHTLTHILFSGDDIQIILHDISSGYQVETQGTLSEQ